MRLMIQAIIVGVALFFGTLFFSNTSCKIEPIEVPSCSIDFDEAVLSREELGLYGWSLLHTMAAYFPPNPSSSQLQHAKSFLHYFTELYPCKQCSKHFEAMLREDPPDFSTRDEFAVFLCKLHNKVNAALGKTQLDCSISHLNKKWGGGECMCADRLLTS
mmetsp:Transcript_23568/g.41777  ORF Transcript_23568/g.41777 Transcript_23568/m.41777 type:complete len:160 (+) Transcript_23568:1966-2445(+)